VTKLEGIPVTTPLRTMIDLAGCLTTKQLETAINEADKLDLIGADDLQTAVAADSPATGVRKLRELLDARSFVLTDSVLERRFARIARRAGLGKPLTRRMVAGHRADFYWPKLGLVVETDGLRYHRTPVQQAKDRKRDQAYATAGLTPLRVTHAQVQFEPDDVVETLRAIATRLSDRTG
jgi:very-short-patch-repair endonuclease